MCRNSFGQLDRMGEIVKSKTQKPMMYKHSGDTDATRLDVVVMVLLLSLCSLKGENNVENEQSAGQGEEMVDNQWPKQGRKHSSGAILAA